METNSGQEMRVAVKCKVCQRVIFYKTTPLSGKIELKCPKCHQITNINLAYRRSKTPLFYRRSTRQPSVTFF
jgi:phage FluMu protein Com